VSGSDTQTSKMRHAPVSAVSKVCR